MLVIRVVARVNGSVGPRDRDRVLGGLACREASRPFTLSHRGRYRDNDPLILVHISIIVGRDTLGGIILRDPSFSCSQNFNRGAIEIVRTIGNNRRNDKARVVADLTINLFSTINGN